MDTTPTRGNGEKKEMSEHALTIRVNKKGISEDFRNLVIRCHQENPDKDDLKALRKQLDGNPELFRHVVIYRIRFRYAGFKTGRNQSNPSDRGQSQHEGFTERHVVSRIPRNRATSD